VFFFTTVATTTPLTSASAGGRGAHVGRRATTDDCWRLRTTVCVLPVESSCRTRPLKPAPSLEELLTGRLSPPLSLLCAAVMPGVLASLLRRPGGACCACPCPPLRPSFSAFPLSQDAPRRIERSDWRASRGFPVSPSPPAWVAQGSQRSARPLLAVLLVGSRAVVHAPAIQLKGLFFAGRVGSTGDTFPFSEERRGWAHTTAAVCLL